VVDGRGLLPAGRFAAGEPDEDCGRRPDGAGEAEVLDPGLAGELFELLALEPD